MGILSPDALSRELLDPRRGRLDAPLRAVILPTPSHLPPAAALSAAQQGALLALAHPRVRHGRQGPVFLPRLRANILALQHAHRCLVSQAARGSSTSPAGEWLLDNLHLISAQTRGHQDGLPRGTYRGLPTIIEGADAGLPRIFAIAQAFVAAHDSAFDEDTLIDWLQGYQQEPGRELGLAELWALPTTLRVVLIDNLRRLAERVVADEAAREAAHALCDRQAQCRGTEAADTFARMARRGVAEAFALQVMQRLHDDPDPGTPQGRLGRESVRVALAAALPDPDAVLLEQQAQRQADHQSVAQAVRAMQTLASADWRRIVSRLSVQVGVLMRAPGFAQERDDTQDTTLHGVERLAYRSRRPESAVARTLLRLMSLPVPAPDDGGLAPQQTPGWWLAGAGRGRLLAELDLRDPVWVRAWQTLRPAYVGLYVASLLVGTAALVFAFMTLAAGADLPAWLWGLAALLACAPAGEVVVALLHRLCSEWAPPRHAPRLDWPTGIPAAHSVLVAMPCMLSSTSSIAELAASLEQHYLANREVHAQFALLSDWPDAASPAAAGDAELLAAAVSAIESLERRHPPRFDPQSQTSGRPQRPADRRFLLLHRWRRWSDSEQRWIGWERKRGKLEQLIAVLADPLVPTPFMDLGDCSRPRRPTTYVLTLDGDTQLPPGVLRELVAVAAHPLNRPVIDAQCRRVEAGHAIFQPRVDVAWPPAGQATPYHSLFAGAWGHDPYNAASSEVYNDLFDEASFCGKGLLHVGAMHAVLGARLPEGQVLSHDLLEGVITRCGGISDVGLLEPAPSHPDVDAARQHRWTRGDWQLGPMLRQPRRYGLNGLGLWKMFENLRRSLVAPLSWLLLLLAFTGVGLNPWVALALGVAAQGTGPLLSAVAGLAPSRDDLALLHFWRLAAAEVLRALAGMLWQLALWPRVAAMRSHAIVVALWRSGVSRRDLLQWTPAGTPAPQVSGRRSPAGILDGSAMLVQLAVFVLVFGLVAGMAFLPDAPAPALLLALCVLWAGTPVWTRWAGRARPLAPPTLTPEDRAYLLALARDTWRFFERHVGSDSNHLPPDNVQTQPRMMVAQRTSPTNIGLYLLSVMTARAFGWIDTAQALERCEATLQTLERLPSHRGHVLNWVDTHTLQILPPAYVSTVDSGNLCMHLLAVAAALDERPPGAAEPAEQARARRAARRCRALAERADFAFLFDARRRLFHIGWNVERARADSGHYDLLASESRLASLWAIAKGDVSAAHWSALGRPFQARGGQLGLRSWSGSMFEYLMPSLVLVEPEGSVLAFAARMAVHEQRQHGRRQGLPWGVSESARAEVDAALVYQYGPQGAPGLALSRISPDERVVAPYATVMAAMREPALAVANLRRLEALGARGSLGFLEALDFTADRTPAAAGGPEIVHTVMAHHQGMSLVALAVVLLDGLPRRWGMAEPSVAAVACLLQERVPREVARLVMPPLPENPPHEPQVAAASVPGARQGMPGGSGLPPTQLLSNGRYAVALRPNGAGFSRWGALDLTRRRDDVLRDAQGSFVFVRREGQARLASVTQHPAGDEKADYACRFIGEQAVFSASWHDLRVQVTVTVSAQDDIEWRRIELWNLSPRPLALEVLSAFEVCLSPERADEMHPAFANLFVSARWDAPSQSLLLARQPRREDDSAAHAAHFLAHADPAVPPVMALADRARWRGRLRPAHQPAAAFEPADALSGERPTGLDPVAALCVLVSLPAHGTALLLLGTAAAADAGALQALVQRGQDLARGSPAAANFLAPVAGSAAALRVGEHAWLRTLATPLLMLVARPPPRLPLMACDRRSLWRHGVSGERPIITVRISQAHGLRLVRALVHGLAWWARGGLAVDLIVLNGEPRSYQMALQHELLALRERQRAAANDATWPTPAGPGALHVWQTTELSAQELATLAQLARLRLHADGRPLAKHVAELVDWHDADLAERQLQLVMDTEPAPVMATGTVHAGSAPAAHFDAASGSCHFESRARRPTPRPWINVLANEDFGALVSESGAGFTWAGNSRLHQLTPWGNDPLTDMDGERFLVQDIASGQVWRIGQGGPAGQAPAGSCRIEHGVGFSRIRQVLHPVPERGPLHLTVTWCVAGESPIKRVEIVVHNAATQPVTLRMVGVLEWMMGCLRGDRRTVSTSCHFMGSTGLSPLPIPLLLATQHDGHDGRGGHTAFLTAQLAQQQEADVAPDADMSAEGSPGLRDSLQPLPEATSSWRPGNFSFGVPGDEPEVAARADWTCDRRELFDDTGRAVLPDRLGQRVGAGLDPCAALAVRLRVTSGSRCAAVFVIGHATTHEAAVALARAEVGRDAAQAERDTRAGWRALLGGVEVSTPDPLFDALMNHWLPYQTVACRLWARAGFYQAGGAYGFRDQLQDAMALAITAPQLLRAHLLRAGARQFVQGDVQHWWHPGTGAGARTRFSDDLLWLPHATLHYLHVTGDRSVLDEVLPFLEGDAIPDGAEDAYFVPQISAHHATLYEHGARAIDRSLAVGAHGLPLMGGGDWNDGMNLVGRHGKGESVWLAWFLCQVVDGFAPLAEQRDDSARALRWRAASRGWRRALEQHAWDGQWYRRAFFDDGSALGSRERAECRIDLIAQAWSVLSEAAPRRRQRQAMASAQRLLADPARGLWRLLDPPLAEAQPSAGYIQAYPPGVRENGGQYAHGGVWAVMALARLGDAQAAWEGWTWLSPAHRSAHRVWGAVYGLEPYAMAADVYSAPPYEGRGGWSWYTGSAGGMHRAGLESLCGLEVAGQRVRLRPQLPPQWTHIRLKLRIAGRSHRFTVCTAAATEPRAQARAEGAVTLAVGRWLDLQATADGSHHVLSLPQPAAADAGEAADPRHEV